MRVDDLKAILNDIPGHYNIVTIKEDEFEFEVIEVDESHFKRSDGRCSFEIQLAFEHCRNCGPEKEIEAVLGLHKNSIEVADELREALKEQIDKTKNLEAKLKRKNLRIKQLVEG